MFQTAYIFQTNMHPTLFNTCQGPVPLMIFTCHWMSIKSLPCCYSITGNQMVTNFCVMCKIFYRSLCKKWREINTKFPSNLNVMEKLLVKWASGVRLPLFSVTCWSIQGQSRCYARLHIVTYDYLAGSWLVLSAPLCGSSQTWVTYQWDHWGIFIQVQSHMVLWLELTHLSLDKMVAISADNIFKCIFLNENGRISIQISLKYVPKGPINNSPALVQIMAWRRSGAKPLSEPMMVGLPMHVCVTRPQWVKRMSFVSS